MSIKKTSILALSVLLSYESFAAPTVLATTPRLGASSSVASTGRGKVTTSVSIGGGLNKLTSSRGQSSFTPNSAPTDKQNELIENFQKEIQNVRDAVAEELQAQNDKIRELESVIEEKDEKIAELEESIDEKIESKGFVTAESVTSEISTAKQEAVRQATNAAVKEVNSMGFAKTATVQSDILSAKNAAIAQAKTEAVAEVNGMGFAKTATINSDILTAKNAAIEQAKNEAVAAVNSMGFVTDTTVQNLKTEITNERNAALKSYATSEQVSNAVTAAKTEITTERNAALKSYATSADVSNAVAILATKKELENLELGVDETTVAGIVDEVLGTKKVISEDTPAFQEVQQQVAAMPTTYAKSSALTSLDTRVTKNAQDITATQAEVDNISDTIAGDLLADTTFKEGVLAGLSTDLKELPSRVDNLEKPTTLEGLLSGKFVKPATLNDYATKDDLNTVDGKFASYVEIDGFNSRLLDSTALDSKFVKPETLTDYATKNALNDYLMIKEFDTNLSKSTALDGKFVKEANFGELLSANGKFKELSTTVSGLGNTYATKSELGNYATATDLANLKKPATLGTLLKDVDLSTNTTISGLGTKYATKSEFSTLNTSVGTLQTNVDNMPTNVIGEMQNSKSKYYIGNWKDDKEQPLIITQATLGTGIDNLLDNKETRLYKIETGVDSLNSNVGKINSNVTSLGSRVDGLNSSFTTLSGKAVTTDNFADKLTANNVVTTANMTTKGVVTRSTLSSDLYGELTSGTTGNGVCVQPTGAKGNLINLLNSETISGCSISGGK